MSDDERTFQAFLKKVGVGAMLGMLLDYVEELPNKGDYLLVLWRDLSMTLRHYEGRYSGDPDS